MASSQFMAIGLDSTFDMKMFQQGFSIDITKCNGNDMEFEMQGVSCAVRPAFSLPPIFSTRTCVLNQLPPKFHHSSDPVPL